MKFIDMTKHGEIATVTLARDKVNALNEPMVEEIAACLEDLEKDRGVKAVILTGRGKFFSFGFDIPEFLNYSKDQFVRYLIKFTDLYRYIFLFPKPVVAALNGHTVAGGCMLALACDHRIMLSGKAKISLNEITFGAPVFAGIVEILKSSVGRGKAETILFSGAMYSAQEAEQLGLIDQVSSTEHLDQDALKIAQEFARKDAAAYRTIKNLLRTPIAREMETQEKDSILKFVDIWYSESTRANLEDIKIYS